MSDIGDLEDLSTHDLVASGGSYAGPELEGDRHDDGELEYLQPIETATDRYALEVDENASLIEERVAAIQADVLKVGLLSIPLTVVVFFLLGGTGLVRRHHAALRRAEHDSLTRLGNHGRFTDRLAAEVRVAEYRREPLCLAIIDLKDFKQLNDRLGHRAGDQALRAVGNRLSNGRVADEGFRIGGDEFAVLMPNQHLDGARTAMKRRCLAIRSLNGDVNLSIGIAALSSDDPDGFVMWEQADQAAYAAKRQAGTTTVTFDDIAEVVAAG